MKRVKIRDRPSIQRRERCGPNEQWHPVIPGYQETYGYQEDAPSVRSICSQELPTPPIRRSLLHLLGASRSSYQSEFENPYPTSYLLWTDNPSLVKLLRESGKMKSARPSNRSSQLFFVVSGID